ncbi:hypothetical protein MMC22_004491 [Lobaria immixta]|nr:hypothetical protein [Lobaria immixta]
MGRSNKSLELFIQEIPDSELTGFSANGGTIYHDNNFRLDMQGMTTGSEYFNIQIQVNRQTTISLLKKMSPVTVSLVLVPVDANWTAAELRAKLMAARKF